MLVINVFHAFKVPSGKFLFKSVPVGDLLFVELLGSQCRFRYWYCLCGLLLISPKSGNSVIFNSAFIRLIIV